MNVAQQIEAGLEAPSMVVNAYLGDLTAEDMLVRPAEGTNHITWQLGHLIAAEHQLIESIAPGRMPALPEGFAERYSKDTAGSDDAASFDSKEELVAEMEKQRAGTLEILRSMSDEDLAQPSPEHIRMLGSTVGAIFLMQGSHYLMHAGQWVIVRRQTGKPVVI
jgi:hypothetical protein